MTKLPEPRQESEVSVEEALRRRRAVRSFADEALTLSQVAQLLWAAQGLTDPAGLRTAPSAGALYPLEVYVVAGEVGGLEAGVYKYRPQKHELAQIAEGDKRAALAKAALDQSWMRAAPAQLVIAAVERRTAVKYGGRAERYVRIEVGHAGQNICLQAVALELDTCIVGAFDDGQVKNLLEMEAGEAPLLIIPVGHAGD